VTTHNGQEYHFKLKNDMGLIASVQARQCLHFVIKRWRTSMDTHLGLTIIINQWQATEGHRFHSHHTFHSTQNHPTAPPPSDSASMRGHFTKKSKSKEYKMKVDLPSKDTATIFELWGLSGKPNSLIHHLQSTI